MKQIGLGLHNFESSQGFFPPSGIRGTGYCKPMNINVDASGKILPVGQRASSYVFTHILPYMEQASVYNSYNIKIDFRSGVNSTAIATLIPSLLCPSSANGDKYHNFDDTNAAGDMRQTGGPWYGVRAAVTDYAVSNGVENGLAATGTVDLTDGGLYSMLQNVDRRAARQRHLPPAGDGRPVQHDPDERVRRPAASPTGPAAAGI
jgi:hypothetical protein